MKNKKRFRENARIRSAPRTNGWALEGGGGKRISGQTPAYAPIWLCAHAHYARIFIKCALIALDDYNIKVASHHVTSLTQTTLDHLIHVTIEMLLLLYD